VSRSASADDDTREYLMMIGEKHDELAADLIAGKVKEENYRHWVGHMKGLREAAEIIKTTRKRLDAM
jgi:hypothetical protein